MPNGSVSEIVHGSARTSTMVVPVTPGPYHSKSGDRTLVVELEHPAPYLPELLTHDTAYPLPRHVVLSKGRAWAKPGNFVGNSAYTPREWIVNDHLTLIKNPRFYDAANVHIDVVTYFPTPDSNAGLRRFRANCAGPQRGCRRIRNCRRRVWRSRPARTAGSGRARRA